MTQEVQNFGETRPFDPEEYLLLVPFGGQLEPKINREYMANGIAIQRAAVSTEGVISFDGIDLSKAQGVVLSGGNDSVYQEGARKVPDELFELGVPILGICYGEQALVHQLGGVVAKSEEGEHGAIEIKVYNSPLFKGVEGFLRGLMNHVDVVLELPNGFSTIAESPAGIAGISNGKDIYAVQFHPESSQTEHGTRILLNFATEICGMEPEPNFSEATYRDRIVAQEVDVIQRELGHPKTRTIVFESGGVDSATAQVLTHRSLQSIGREHTVSGRYIDNGLMRHEDGDTIRILNNLGYRVETEDWSQFFLHEPVPLPKSEAMRRGYTHFPPLDQVTDPTVMRQIVKYGFIEVQRRIGQDLRNEFTDAEVIALVQGTNLADKIESGDFNGDQIKEHHNSGVQAYVDLLIEPLASFFKGDIRMLAEALGLPIEIVRRQPFPGPGLCLRIPANSTGETIWPDYIDRERRKLERICRKIGSGAMFGCWLPFEATGQKGDSRIHANVVAIFGKYDPELIKKLAFDIPASTPASRVLYTSQEIDPDAVRSIYQMVNETSLEPLRDAEEVKSQSVSRTGLGAELSQHFAASLPVSLDEYEKAALMLRMVRTGVSSGLEDYIDAEAALGGLNVDGSSFSRTLEDVSSAAIDLGFGSKVLLDVTDKPPGTIELA